MSTKNWTEIKIKGKIKYRKSVIKRGKKRKTVQKNKYKLKKEKLENRGKERKCTEN